MVGDDCVIDYIVIIGDDRFCQLEQIVSRIT